MAFASDPSAAPVLADSFNTTTYTGSPLGTPYSVTGIGFRPDFVWINVGTAHQHYIVDTLRGTTGRISSSSTAGDPAYSPDEFQSFDSDGYTLIPTSGGGRTAYDLAGGYVMAWKANPIPTINTDGSNTNVIVAANQAAGFSIIKWTGDGVNNATIGHGLSGTPELLIMKTLSVIDNWLATSTYLDFANGYLFFNQTGAETTTLSGDGSITRDGLGATTFTCTAGSSTSNNTNKLNDQYIAYAFKSIAGFSKIGEYTGTGGSNTQSINTGFAASFVMIKDYNIGGSWWMQDIERGSKSLKANAVILNQLLIMLHSRQLDLMLQVD